MTEYLLIAVLALLVTAVVLLIVLLVRQNGINRDQEQQIHQMADYLKNFGYDVFDELDAQRDDNVAAMQQTADGQIDRFRAAAGEDDAFGLLHVQQTGGFLTAGLYHASCPQSKGMTATAGVAAQLFHGARYRPDDLGRLWETGGGVIQINHVFHLLCTK